MRRLRVTRRMVVTGAVSIAGVGLWFGWRNRFSLQLFLRLQQDTSRPDLEPCEPGALSEVEKERLQQVLATLDGHWALDGLDPGEFLAVLDLKTTRPPSYLAEYRRALAVFDTKGGVSIEAILETLAAPSKTDDRFTDEAHVQSNVIEEFLRLSLARGGFQQFGLTNHPGFWGGEHGYRLARGGG